jgi:hypothetical protein
MKLTFDLLRQARQLANAGSEKHGETFLPEVVVMRQDVAGASLPHCVHRDTIRQAKTLSGRAL